MFFLSTVFILNKKKKLPEIVNLSDIIIDKVDNLTYNIIMRIVGFISILRNANCNNCVYFY